MRSLSSVNSFLRKPRWLKPHRGMGWEAPSNILLRCDAEVNTSRTVGPGPPGAPGPAAPAAAGQASPAGPPAAAAGGVCTVGPDHGPPAKRTLMLGPPTTLNRMVRRAEHQ